MTPRGRKLAYGLLVLLAAGAALLFGADLLHTHAALRKQMKAGLEAFGGLLGIALIGIAAVAFLLVADAWMDRGKRRDRDGEGP